MSALPARRVEQPYNAHTRATQRGSVHTVYTSSPQMDRNIGDLGDIYEQL